MRALSRSNVRVRQDLRGLRPLLEAWTDVLDSYCRAHGFEDNPWFYNERATLSTLAGAAWRLNGWTALEEFATKKWGGRPKEGGVESGALRRGRCDLHVSHGSTSFAIEAKQAWQPIGRTRSPFARADEALLLAKKDARALTNDAAHWRLAVVFTVPILPVAMVRCAAGKVERAQVMDRVDAWLDDFNARGHDAAAHYFTSRCEAMISSDRKRLYPGVALSVDICKRANKASAR